MSASNIPTLDTISKSMSESVSAGKYGKELKQFVAQLKATTVGKILPEIIQKDTTGTDIRLENKNGFLLLKFWSSENKNSIITNSMTKKLYNEYNNDTLKIISISLDNDKEKWIKSIKDNNIPWTQVSDLKSYNNDAVIKLAIRVIPENLLVDPNNIIVGRNISNDSITTIIDKYLNDKYDKVDENEDK